MKKTAVSPPQVGQHIFAYCNVGTNQVLYSLDRFLKPKSLKQLPDIGANHTPPSLRKDSWRPLWAVTLPPTETGYAQGLDAFKRLREYRKLHELCWKPTKAISRPTPKHQIEEMQKKLDERGGSKKENVYDIIRRKKHNMKVRIIMNQKANSIADLAAVLQEQEELGVTREKKALNIELEEILALAQEAENGALKRLPKELASIKEQGKNASWNKRRWLAKQEDELTLKIKKMELVRDAVAKAREQGEELVKAGGAKSELPEDQSPADSEIQKAAEVQTGDEVQEREPNTPKEGIHRKAALEAGFRQMLPFFPPELRNESKPIFLAEGVTVHWANLLDAEFAYSWPEHVSHERIHTGRHAFTSWPASTAAARSTEAPVEAKTHEAQLSDKPVEQPKRREVRDKEKYGDVKGEALVRLKKEKRAAKKLKRPSQKTSQTRPEVLKEVQSEILRRMLSRPKTQGGEDPKLKTAEFVPEAASAKEQTVSI